MNTKIKNYVDVLFSDIPRTKKAIELKEEILSNLSERFDDYLAQGKTEAQAYSLAVSNMGDIDEMLESVKPGVDFVAGANKYRRRNARNTAIAVVLYILGLISLITLGAIGEITENIIGFGMGDFMSVIGFISMLVFAAIATAILIYSYMSVPVEYKDYNSTEMAEKHIYKNKEQKMFENIMGIYWSIITIIYLVVSFATSSWGITWLIWPIAGIVSSIIKTIYEMRNTCDE